MDRIKLKHLKTIVSEDIDYKVLMKEVVGFNNNPFFRKVIFKKKFKELQPLIEQIRKIDLKTIEHYNTCSIKKPANIDNISFLAMMEVGTLSSKANGVLDLMAELITIVCYSSNVDGKYSSSSIEYADFKKRVLDMPALHAFGLYNWIDKALVESNKFWEQRFFDVEVEDPDYEQAGGNMMNGFNVVNSIKSICSDFNVTYDEAWQLSYALTQTSALSKATQNYIQDQMRIIKERRMKQKRDS